MLKCESLFIIKIIRCEIESEIKCIYRWSGMSKCIVLCEDWKMCELLTLFEFFKARILDIISFELVMSEILA